jgi:hypothetical protein
MTSSHKVANSKVDLFGNVIKQKCLFGQKPQQQQQREQKKFGSFKEKSKFVKCVSIAPYSLHSYITPEKGYKYSSKHQKNQVNLSNNSTDGIISSKAAKNIEKCLNWLLYEAKVKFITDITTGKKFYFKINMITLTLPSHQIHSDSLIKSTCLASFLDTLIKVKGLSNYLWRAEAQVNGNIHFHLITDTYIHHQYIREQWNKAVNKLGYVDRFAVVHGHSNPNSTDVHSIKHVNRLVSYVSKYICKNRSFAKIGELRQVGSEIVEVLYGSDKYRSEEANKKQGKVIASVIVGKIRPIEGRLWFASRSLSDKKSFVLREDEYDFSNLSDLINHSSFRVYRGEFITSYYGEVLAIAKELKCDFVCS